MTDDVHDPWELGRSVEDLTDRYGGEDLDLDLPDETLALIELRNRTMKAQAAMGRLRREIDQRLGSSLTGHDRNAYWYGDTLYRYQRGGTWRPHDPAAIEAAVTRGVTEYGIGIRDLLGADALKLKQGGIAKLATAMDLEKDTLKDTLLYYDRDDEPSVQAVPKAKAPKWALEMNHEEEE